MIIPSTREFVTLGLLLASGPSAVAQERASEEREVVAVAEAALAAISDEDMVALTDLMIDEAITFSVSERGGRLSPNVTFLRGGPDSLSLKKAFRCG